jgi:hypothetical protein
MGRFPVSSLFECRERFGNRRERFRPNHSVGNASTKIWFGVSWLKNRLDTLASSNNFGTTFAFISSLDFEDFDSGDQGIFR